MSPDTMAFFGRITSDLSRAPAGSVLPVDPANLILSNVLPHYWREEADTPEEWFIRMCRGLGLHATYDPFSNRFKVRITKDAADEDTITWPGKS